MKKDSFTFSDKLKKSKTLPLSKRIPSRVGGEVKAKRTLFERAQRDLPFIIVAALALLLLPFLSRETGDIETPSVVWGDGGDTYIEDFNKPQSSEGEIALSSFRNPLDLIIRHGEKDGSAKDTVDTYGSGSEESEGSSYSERSSYGSEDYSTSPATSRYGKTVKRSVRNSINRVPTAIGSLRAGSMVSPGGASSIGHKMATGSRAKDAAPKVQGPGVRPVALQPLQAAGKGRDLTGDALYAEAARSIGAMNTPGAKQALMEAQLKDVDGKPLGETKSAGAAAAAGKPGAGGSPSNNWGHKAITPWWWDMMKQRAQKRWELWHYNWEKMASDSLIKLTAGLASCLITGSNDFAVGKFLGDYRGDDNVLCVGEGGKEVFISFNDFIDRLKVAGGKDGSGSAVQQGDWYAMCEKAGGVADFKGASGYKSPLDVRLRCLGIRLSDIKNKYETKKDVICDGLYSDPMYINISVTKNSKVKQKALDEMGFYVVGNKKGCQGDSILYIAKAKQGKNMIPQEFADEVKKVVVYRVGEYGKQFYPEGNTKYPRTVKDKDGNEKTIDRDLKQYQDKKGKYNSEEEIYWESGDYDYAFNIAQKRIKNECLSEQDLQNLLKPIGKWRTDVNSRIKDLFNEVAICQGDYLRGVKFDPVEMASANGPWSDNLRMEDCRDKDVFISSVPTTHKFSTTITNPGARTIAFILERVEGSIGTGVDDKNKKEGFVVKSKIDFSTEGYKYRVVDNKDGSKTFTADVEVGRSVSVKDDTPGKDDQIANARPGEGMIVWVTTNDLSTKGAEVRSGPYDQPKVSDLFNTIGKRSTVCHYRWGCDHAGVCDSAPNDIDKYCYVIDKQGVQHYYEAVKVEGYPNMLFRGKGAEITDADVSGNACDDICIYKQNPKTFKVLRWNTAIPEDKMTNVYTADCPVCNPNDKVKPVGDTQCYIITDEEEHAHCYSSIVLKSGGQPYHIRISEEEITPCNETQNVCWNICVDKENAIRLSRIGGSSVYWGILLTKNPNDIYPVVPGDPVLCPFCNPGDNNNPNDNNNPSEGKCHIDDVVYPSTSFKGIDGQTYHIRTSATSTSGPASYPCTPICAAKAKALGIFQTEGIDSTVPVDPETPLTENQNDISPVKPGTPLCPYCNPDPGDESVPEQPNYTEIITGPCEVQLIGEFFWNASYDLKKQLPLAKIYEVMHNCDNPIIEGHASKTIVTDDNNNNKRLSFDRAMEVAKQVQEEWARHGVALEVTPTNDGLGRYAGVAPDRYWVKYRSWPKQRNSISNPSNSSETVTIYGVGDRDAQFQRPALPRGKKAWPKDDEAYYRLQESKDRKVIIKGTVRN